MTTLRLFIEAPANAALQASITPVGIEFGMNKLRLGENYCRIYGIFMLPTEVEYGWLSKLTNIPRTIVTINYEPRNNAEAINDLSRKIRMFRGQAAGTKDPKERMRCEKAALSQETALQRMDSGNESMGVWDITIMVGDRIKQRRSQLGLTQNQVSEITGIKSNTISNYENNISAPSEENIYKLMEALKCDANYLFEWEAQNTLRKTATTSAGSITARSTAFRKPQPTKCGTRSCQS